MNVVLQANSERVKAIQRNMSRYKFKLSLDRLGVSKYFQFSFGFRDQLIMKEKGNGKEESRMNYEQSMVDKEVPSAAKPFERTIAALKEIPEINSPMAKLEYIYQVFNKLMIQEIDDFWQPALDINAVDPDHLQIDYENLNGIAIYVALKAGLPILLVDV